MPPNTHKKDSPDFSHKSVTALALCLIINIQNPLNLFCKQLGRIAESYVGFIYSVFDISILNFQLVRTVFVNDAEKDFFLFPLCFII